MEGADGLDEAYVAVAGRSAGAGFDAGQHGHDPRRARLPDRARSRQFERTRGHRSMGDPADPDGRDNHFAGSLPTEAVFEHGFYPLKGGVRFDRDRDRASGLLAVDGDPADGPGGGARRSSTTRRRCRSRSRPTDRRVDSVANFPESTPISMPVVTQIVRPSQPSTLGIAAPILLFAAASSAAPFNPMNEALRLSRDLVARKNASVLSDLKALKTANATNLDDLDKALVGALTDRQLKAQGPFLRRMI